MLLAGDVGGTKTLLGLFRHAPDRPFHRPEPVVIRAYPTIVFRSFTEILNAFEHETAQPLVVDAAAVGVAGPLVDERATLTNIPWDISAAEIAARCGLRSAHLINDLEALAMSVEALTADELLTLQAGVPSPRGNAVVIAAGTGLGEAYLHRVGGRLRPVPSEGGHADFAARSEREIALTRMLRDLYGRAEVEHVLSGPGLLNLHRLTHDGVRCHAVTGIAPEAALVSEAALTSSCPACVETLQMFVSAYGAEAGNLGLRGVATAGVFVGGGIAPKILPLLQTGEFLHSFLDKPPMTALLQHMPLHVILNAQAGLLGAAITARDTGQISS